jgi:transcriptional regulator of acetoin/glycerol metabolism
MGSAKPFLQVLESAVKGSGFIITLADEDGYVLEVLGDEDILKMASANNYLVGCRRAKDEVGTNAIGLSLYLKKPIQLTGCEHCNVNHHSWTCSSSPIFSPEKELLGTITFSGKTIGVHQHTSGMVISAGKAIENKIGERRFSQEKDNLSCYLNCLLDSVSEGIIAIKEDGKITHINRIAEKILNISKRSMVEKSLKAVVDIGPIEKAPLYHFVLDHFRLWLTCASCNLRCKNCQNWHLSQSSSEEQNCYSYTPEGIVKQAQSHNLSSISFTYTEPTVYYEYLYDISSMAKPMGLKTSIVSNGYVN